MLQKVLKQTPFIFLLFYKNFDLACNKTIPNGTVIMYTGCNADDVDIKETKMKKMIALALVGALMVGSFATPAMAAAPTANNTQITEKNKRPDYRPGHHQPGPPRPGNRPGQNHPGHGHRPPAPQPSHRPDHRPGGHHSSSKSNFGWGMVVGAVIGSAIAHAAR